jgi:hypothetical protein|nr:MAG TPA: hypothetical protein [Caudoviricetes sp.]
MKIVNKDGTKILECQSIFISAVYDDTDKNLVIGYNIKGSLANGRTEVIAKFDSEDKAKKMMGNLIIKFGACTEAMEW